MILEPLLVNEKPHSTVTVTHEILRSVDSVPEALRRGGGGGGGVGTLELTFQDPSPPLPPPRVSKQQKSL